MKAFRKALSRIVDSANLLKLPDASAEVAGLYADLVHRQLHRVAQFIKVETEVEVQALPEPVPMPAPVPVPAHVTAPATAPVAAPTNEARQVPEEWVVDWTGTNL